MHQQFAKRVIKAATILAIGTVLALHGCIYENDSDKPECPETQAADAGPKKVFALLQMKCSGCHDENGQWPVQALKLHNPDSAYLSMVNRITMQKPYISPKMLVQPGALAESYLFHKISTGNPKSGYRMPTGDSLTLEEQQLIAEWILAGAPEPEAEESSVQAGLCYTCDEASIRNRKTPCHPCNGPQPPDYCVDDNFFRDSLVGLMAYHCGSCHNNTSPPYEAQGNLTLDTNLDADAFQSLRQRYRNIYENLVERGSNILGGVSPFYRVAPSDTLGSLLYQSVIVRASQISEWKSDSIPDMLQYKLRAPMPYSIDGSDLPPNDTLVGRLRRWILSGAPGPGDLSVLPDTRPSFGF